MSDEYVVADGTPRVMDSVGQVSAMDASVTVQQLLDVVMDWAVKSEKPEESV